MSDEPTEPSKSKELVPRAGASDGEITAEVLDRLQADLARYRAALEEIRDQTFEQANSQRLIDQLWHFVRWTKATARSALEQPGERTRK
ncbi:MAG: hypothetical protein ACJ0SL_01785 [Candidatus Rariloculaceae bacterium]